MPAAPEGSGSPTIRQDPARRVGFGALMLLGFGLGALPVFLGALNHDVGWYLHAAGRLLGGDRLYVDLIDTNPPLIVWLNVPPRLLARSLGISEILTLRALTLGLVAASLAMTRWVLVAAWPDRPGDRRWALLLSMFVLLPLPGNDFAQREHLMLILAWPYLLMASGRSAGGHPAAGLAVVVGVSAGVGLSLKPHFVLPWLAIEASLGTRRGWRIWSRPESLAVAASGVAYAIAVVALTPEYLRWMSWAGPLYSAACRSSFLASCGEPGAVVSAVALLGFLASRPGREGGEALDPILVADLGFLAIALLQDKGYPYHFYPPMALGGLLVGLLAWGSSGLSPARRPGVVPVMMRGTLAALALSVAVARVHDSRTWRGRPGDSETTLGRMIRVVDRHADGGPVFTFSAAVGAAFPMVNYGGVGWASRHPALWFLPAYHPRGFDAGRPPEGRPAMGEAERFLFDSVVDELLARRPTLLFVDESEHHPAFDGRRFHYLDYYSLDPRFAEFLRDYEPLTRLDDFRVYRRKARISGPLASIDWPRMERGSAERILLQILVRSVAREQIGHRLTTIRGAIMACGRRVAAPWAGRSSSSRGIARRPRTGGSG